MPDKRSWRERQESEWGRITAEQAQEQKRERQAAEYAARTRCRCKEPMIRRKYMGAGLCLLCGLPRYEAPPKFVRFEPLPTEPVVEKKPRGRPRKVA